MDINSTFITLSSPHKQKTGADQCCKQYILVVFFFFYVVVVVVVAVFFFVAVVGFSLSVYFDQVDQSSTVIIKFIKVPKDTYVP